MSALFYSCGSSRILRKGPVPNRSTMDLLNALEWHNFDFEWFSAKAKIKFESTDDSGKATVNIRMKKDSVIWMNVKKLAVEISRLQITPDSIHVLYRLDQMFETSSYEEMMGFYGLNVTFRRLQNLIIGNCLLPGEVGAQSETDSLSYYLSGELDEMELNYSLDPYTLLLNQFVITDKNAGKVQVSFDKYKILKDSLHFSYFREYVAFSEEDSATAKVDLSSVEINVPKRVRFAIPDHYGEYK